jgi:hypothetical protein
MTSDVLDLVQTFRRAAVIRNLEGCQQQVEPIQAIFSLLRIGHSDWLHFILTQPDHTVRRCTREAALRLPAVDYSQLGPHTFPFS